MSDVLTLLPDSSESGGSVRMVVFDFDGVFTDNTVFCDDAGGEIVRCWRGDGLGLQKLRRLQIPAFVLSTEVHPVVGRRCQKLAIPCRQGLQHKEEELRKLSGETGVDLKYTVYLGNDINDAACLRLVGLPIVVSDAHPDVLRDARYRTRNAGGFGAVREVCDWIDRSMAAGRRGASVDRA